MQIKQVTVSTLGFGGVRPSSYLFIRVGKNVVLFTLERGRSEIRYGSDFSDLLCRKCVTECFVTQQGSMLFCVILSIHSDY